MYFFEQKVVLPITDDILRQTGGIEGLRKRICNADCVYLSTDRIVVPIFFEYRLAHYYGSGEREKHTTVRDLGDSKKKEIALLLEPLEIKYNPDDLKFIEYQSNDGWISYKKKYLELLEKED